MTTYHDSRLHTIHPARAFPRLTSPAGAAGLAAALLLSLGFGAWLFTLPFLAGDTAFWQQQNSDITQYVAGFNAFIHEPWRWPLLRIESLNWPTGTLATFVDTVPLYALILKLFAHGPDTPFWNPYGYWIALCYALQGVGAWWICREAGLRSWPALLVMALLLAAFPALSFRIHHTSLMSQWLLLFALACYLRSTRLGRFAWGAWMALIPLAFYINIYLFSMLSALYAADVLRHLRHGQWRRTLAFAAATYGLLFASMAITMLPLGPSSGLAEWGFGFYSMNLLAPLSGGRLLAFAHPVAHGGQGEGFNYLGVFLIAAAAWALYLRLKADRGFVARHGWLCAAALLLVLYALSVSIYLGDKQLLQLPLPPFLEGITGHFRVSGRFFWPVGYLVVVVTVICIARYAPRRLGAPLLVLLALLQLWDLHPHHMSMRQSTQLGDNRRLDETAWKAFMGPSVDRLYFYPAFRCEKNPANDTILPAMLFAAKNNLDITTAYIARARRPCEGVAEEIAAADAQRSAFAFVRGEYPDLAAVQQLLGGAHAARCVEADFAWLCKRSGGAP